MMAELLTLVYIRDVNLYARTLQAADAILQGDAGMGIAPRIDDDAVRPLKIGAVHLINEGTLDIFGVLDKGVDPRLRKTQLNA